MRHTNRRNSPQTLTTPAQVIRALGADPAALSIAALRFMTHTMAEAGHDLNPVHLAGIVRTNAVKRVELGKANAAVPMLREAAELVAALPR